MDILIIAARHLDLPQGPALASDPDRRASEFIPEADVQDADIYLAPAAIASEHAELGGNKIASSAVITA